MTREVAIYEIENLLSCSYIDELRILEKEALKMAIEVLKQEPCEDVVSIPYLMHKEMDIPLLECQKAYDVAIDYLQRQGKISG